MPGHLWHFWQIGSTIAGAAESGKPLAHVELHVELHTPSSTRGWQGLHVPGHLLQFWQIGSTFAGATESGLSPAHVELHVELHVESHVELHVALVRSDMCFLVGSHVPLPRHSGCGTFVTYALSSRC